MPIDKLDEIKVKDGIIIIPELDVIDLRSLDYVPSDEGCIDLFYLIERFMNRGYVPKEVLMSLVRNRDYVDQVVINQVLEGNKFLYRYFIRQE